MGEKPLKNSVFGILDLLDRLLGDVHWHELRPTVDNTVQGYLTYKTHPPGTLT